jgi:hypothetical protein
VCKIATWRTAHPQWQNAQPIEKNMIFLREDMIDGEKDGDEFVDMVHVHIAAMHVDHAS